MRARCVTEKDVFRETKVRRVFQRGGRNGCNYEFQLDSSNKERIVGTIGSGNIRVKLTRHALT